VPRTSTAVAAPQPLQLWQPGVPAVRGLEPAPQEPGRRAPSPALPLGQHDTGVVTAGAESRRWVPSRESAPPRGDPVVQGLSSRRVRRRAGLRRRLPGPRAVCPAPPVSVGAVGQPPGGHLSAFGTSGWFTRPSATAYDERMRCLWSGPVAPERFVGGGSSSHNALCWPCDFLPSPPP
ncbi:hypothetical protein IscW_ISCW011865, partial [Ixodes scapularis]